MKILFVSKPVVPPWNDGSKNLVRDVASHLVRARATVMVGPGAQPLGPRVRMLSVYRDAGRFAPALSANARVFARLATDEEHDVWHFVFAPNPASSAAARAARRVRRFRGAVVQTVASRPRGPRVRSLVFGDFVVALGEWSRGMLVGAGVPASRVRVIPPCAARPDVDAARVGASRARLGVGAAPIVLYPGDYEVSTGALTVAHAAPAILRAVPEARLVFACRRKTARSDSARRAVVAALGAHAARSIHAGDVDDMPALVAAADVVAFPVDDLTGKVDVPLVLLEALALGVPLVLARGGPLEAVETARFVPPRDPDALASAVAAALRAGRDAAGPDLWRARFAPERVAALHDDLYDDALRATKARRA